MNDTMIELRNLIEWIDRNADLRIDAVEINSQLIDIYEKLKIIVDSTK